MTKTLSKSNFLHDIIQKDFQRYQDHSSTKIMGGGKWLLVNALIVKTIDLHGHFGFVYYRIGQT